MVLVDFRAFRFLSKMWFRVKGIVALCWSGILWVALYSAMNFLTK